MTRELAQVLVIPRRLDAAEDAGDRRGVIPADAESVAVGRLGPSLECRLWSISEWTWVDQRVDLGVEHLGEQDR